MAAPNRGLLRKLAEWDTGGLPVTSLYLDVDGRHRPRRGDYVARTQDLLRGARDAGSGDREAGRSVLRDLERIRRYVTDEFDRRGVRGVAVFACHGAGLWEDVRLSLAVRDRLVVRPRPYLLPMESAVERSETISVALVDRQRARILRAVLGEIHEISDLLDEVPGRHDQGGWAQARHQRHIEDHVQRHLKHVAEVLLRARERGGFDRLVLSGPQEVLAALDRELHDYVRRTIADRTHLPVTATPQEVLAHVRSVEERLERQREARAVRRLSENGGSGQVVSGLDATLEALGAGRVETLVVADDLEISGVRCPSCGRLATIGARCPVCGSPTEETADLSEEAVESALLGGSRVETTRGSDLSAMGGIGALLRF